MRRANRYSYPKPDRQLFRVRMPLSDFAPYASSTAPIRGEARGCRVSQNGLVCPHVFRPCPPPKRKGIRCSANGGGRCERTQISSPQRSDPSVSAPSFSARAIVLEERSSCARDAQTGTARLSGHSQQACPACMRNLHSAIKREVLQPKGVAPTRNACSKAWAPRSPMAEVVRNAAPS